jgi:hypothetical protein
MNSHKLTDNIIKRSEDTDNKNSSRNNDPPGLVCAGYTGLLWYTAHINRGQSADRTTGKQYSDADQSYVLDAYNSCAGSGCKNIGLHLLRVRFVNKNGWFCNSCKNSLLADMLVEQVVGSSLYRQEPN